ncbi:MAG: hypothetical protein SVK08_07020 [Halobacteriota archaeon]|nr:hypothetical protein [Halobacteriota archaeon]
MKVAMCDLTEGIMGVVGEFEGDFRLKEAFKQRIEKSSGYTIGTTNLYPTEGQEVDLFNDLVSSLEDYLKDHLNEKGEIQILRVSSGENIDIGIKQANVLCGRVFEMYCYKCFSITFLRVWLEEGIFIKKRWISVDVDELTETPWFSNRD